MGLTLQSWLEGRKMTMTGITGTRV
jgi:hypothetical protein